MWKDSYAIGVAHIDEQHKALFDAVEALKSRLVAGGDVSYKQSLAETIAFMKGYAVKHFQDEEDYQIEIGYPGYEAHRELHNKAIKSVLEFEKELIETQFAPESVKKFLGFLITWLTYHVAGEDQKIPKKEVRAVVEKKDVDDFVLEFAEKAKDVFKVITGMADDDLDHKIGDIPMESAAGYIVGLVNSEQKKHVGFIFSKTIAFGVIKAITGLDVSRFDEIVYSVLEEISNIVSAQIALVLSTASITCDIEAPRLVDVSKLTDKTDIFTVTTKLGDMKIFVA